MDVSRTALSFGRPILQMLLANQGLRHPRRLARQWIPCRLGRAQCVGRQRRRCLAQDARFYNRNSDWDLSVCTVSQTNPCPEYAKRYRDFPTALREHLAKNGYSLDGIAARVGRP